MYWCQEEPISCPPPDTVICQPTLVCPDPAPPQVTQAPQQAVDSVHMAMELGRLDLITTLLAILGIFIGIIAIIGLGYFHWRVGRIAKKTADEVAKKVANEYYRRRDLEESKRKEESPQALDPKQVDVSRAKPEGGLEDDAQ